MTNYQTVKLVRSYLSPRSSRRLDGMPLEKVVSDESSQDPSSACRSPSSAGRGRGVHRCDRCPAPQRVHTPNPTIRGPGHNKSHGIMVKLIRMNNATKPYPAAPAEAMLRHVNQLRGLLPQRACGLRLLSPVLG